MSLVQGGLGKVRLKGFGIARRGTGEVPSNNEQQDNKIKWWLQLYAHPNRQFINLNKDEGQFYEARTNLQPIDPNMTLSPPSEDRSDVQTLPAREYFKYKHDIYSMGVILLEMGLWRDLTPRDSPLKNKMPTDRKANLLRLADDELGLHMGQRFVNIVKACLNVDDSGWDAYRLLDELSDIRL